MEPKRNLIPLCGRFTESKSPLQNEMSVWVARTVEQPTNSQIFHNTYNHIWSIMSNNLLTAVVNSSIPSGKERWGKRSEKASDKAKKPRL